MQLFNLIQRAKEIRAKYELLEQKKYGQTWTSAQIMEGLVVDVGDLMKVVQAKQGIRQEDNVDEKLQHELSDCLWSLLILADKYGVDLEAAFVQNMSSLEDSLDKQLEMSSQ